MLKARSLGKAPASDVTEKKKKMATRVCKSHPKCYIVERYVVAEEKLSCSEIQRDVDDNQLFIF